MERGVCDTCGEPATCWARDVIRTANIETGCYDHGATGGVKRGCEKHPVDSETFTSNGLPFPIDDMERELDFIVKKNAGIIKV